MEAQSCVQSLSKTQTDLRVIIDRHCTIQKPFTDKNNQYTVYKVHVCVFVCLCVQITPNKACTNLLWDIYIYFLYHSPPHWATMEAQSCVQSLSETQSDLRVIKEAFCSILSLLETWLAGRSPLGRKVRLLNWPLALVPALPEPSLHCICPFGVYASALRMVAPHPPNVWLICRSWFLTEWVYILIGSVFVVFVYLGECTLCMCLCRWDGRLTA